MAPFRILSIDGGGIRGLVPALLLAELEARAGRPVSQLFDLIAGTSTGGILALGLTRPGPDGRPMYGARDLVKLYEGEGSKIFSRPLWKRITSVESLADEKYPSEPIESVLAKYFGDARLHETLTDVIVPAYEIERRIPFIFKSRYARDTRRRGYDFFMRDVARATSAAPTFFEPARIAAAEVNDYWALIDGGVYANNPAMCALAEARDAYVRQGDVVVVSIGTGDVGRRIPYDSARNWGLAAWALPILYVVFDGVSDTVDFQLRQMLPPVEGVDRYFRMQVALEPGNEDMDDASEHNLRALRLQAEDLIRMQDRSLSLLARLLTPDGQTEVRAITGSEVPPETQPHGPAK